MKFKKLVGCVLFCAAFAFPNALAAPPNVSNINDVFAYIADKVHYFDLKNFNDEKANNLTDIIDGTILKKHKAPEIGFVKFNDLASEYWKLFDKNNGNCRVAAICISDLLTKANVENYVIDFYCREEDCRTMANELAHTNNIFKASDGKWKILDFYHILSQHNQCSNNQYDYDNIKKGNATLAYDDYWSFRVNYLSLKYGKNYLHAAAIRNFETFSKDGNYYNGDYDIGEFMKIKGYNFGNYKSPLFFVTNFENLASSQQNSSQQILGGNGSAGYPPRWFVDTVCKFLSPNKSNPMDLRALAKANNMTPSKYIVIAVNDYSRYLNQV